MKSMKIKKPKDGSSISKFNDITKSAKERLQAFLNHCKGTGKEGKSDAAVVTREHADDIIYLIYEAFWQYLDTVNTKKNKKSGPEESDLTEIVLPSLEKVLQYLPDKINSLWHFNSIGVLFKEIFCQAHFLAPNEPLEFIKKGIKLITLWILGLVEQCNDPNNKLVVDIFKLIVPEITHCAAEDPMTPKIFQESVMPKFQCLMENLTANITSVYWQIANEKQLRERQIEGFKTLFNLCKDNIISLILCGKRKETPRSSRKYHGGISVSSSTSSLHSRRSEVPGATPTMRRRLERIPSTSSNSLKKSMSGTLNNDEEEPCGVCHLTDRCTRCPQCNDGSHHQKKDCPISIHGEVTGHFENVRTLVAREWSSEDDLELFSGLHDEIMKWFVKQGKSILPHDRNYCSFMVQVGEGDEKTLVEDEEQVKICEIVDRVLFTDKKNIELMNCAFKDGPLGLQRRKEDSYAELISCEDNLPFSFTKMITLYSELINNIKDYNVLGKMEKCSDLLPEFLSDSRSSHKKTHSKHTKIRIKSFLKSVTLNVSPLLRYPEAYSTFSTGTKKKIERLEVMIIGFYLVIVQQIEQCDAISCYRIILCMIKNIEHNHDKGIPLSSYQKQLSTLLNVVRFVGRKVILPYQTWEHLRALLFKLESSPLSCDMANDIWYDVMECLTYEIFVQVYGVEYRKSCGEKDEKHTKTKGKLPGNIEEKSNLARLNEKFAKLKAVHRPKWNEKPNKSKHPSGERQRSEYIEIHYHGRNEVFMRSTEERNSNENNVDDQTDYDDELRPNDGEHPIVLWRRFLTLKGNPNNYKIGTLQRKMFESLSKIVKHFLWLDKNKQDRKRCSSHKYREEVKEHPVMTYVYHILPWFFEAFMTSSSDEFLPGKKVAMEMLCKCLIRSNPMKPPLGMLHLFYNVLLNCLRKERMRTVERLQMGNRKCFEKTKQDLLFEVVRGTRHLFSINLSGCLLPEVMNCLSEAAMSVLDPTLAFGPKAEAIIMLGSLYTYPWTSESLRQQIVVKVKDVAKTETQQSNRCKAIQMLGYMIMTILSKRCTGGRDTPESPTQIMERIKISFPDEHASIVQRADAQNLVDLIKIVMCQVRSMNSKISLSALSVIRDIAKDFDKLLLVDPTLPKQIIESLLSSLNTHMGAQRAQLAEDMSTERYSMKSSPSGIFDPIHDPLAPSSFPHSMPPMPHLPGKESIIKYQEAVITNTIMSLVDWVLNIPEHIHSTKHRPGSTATTADTTQFVHYAEEYTNLLKTVFKVLQLVALEKSFTSYVESFTTSLLSKIKEYTILDIKEAEENVEQISVESSLPNLPGSDEPYIHKNIKSCAEAALLVFCQRYHQFPLCGGPDYSSSMVFEYNMDERNGDMKYFERNETQVLIMDNSTIISLVELSTIPEEVELKLDLPFESQTGFSRVIFRNVAGRFSWLSKRLFSLKEPPNSPPPLLNLLDHTDNLPMVKDCPTLTPSMTLFREETTPVSAHPISLYETIEHIKRTSGEISFYRKLGKECSEEDPLFNKVQSMLRNQKKNEENADNSTSSDTPDSNTMSSDASYGCRSEQITAGSPFQQCRSLASSLGLLSWQKRFSTHGRQVELLDQTRLSDKEKDIRGGLHELDNVFNREIHKFGIIYVARGDENRKDALSHNVGSPEFEEFVAGLGWEVNWKDLRGYAPTIGTEMKSTTCHYADPTLEILFHVGTRLEPGNQEAALYRFKYIGNDYVVVIWSEHDRDVNIDNFKSSYLDYVIVIYPVKDLKKCRVQVIVDFGDNKEKHIEHGIGPLFDGALVDRDILPELVRKTIINADRFIIVDQKRPRFYRDRAKSLNKLQNYKREVTYEELACELMSPSLINFEEFKDYSRSNVPETKQPPQRSNSRMNKKPTTRQSTGYSSQENMSENEKTKSDKKSNKRYKRESDSDTVYSKR